MYFALVNYRSRLVAVGGENAVMPYYQVKKLLVSEDGKCWDSSLLPPLSTSRIAPVAVTFGNPEILLVAGGLSEELEEDLDTVEVLVGEQWSSVKSLRLPHKRLGDQICACIHNQSLYLMSMKWNEYFYCPLKLLQSAITSPKETTEGTVWKEMRSTVNLRCPASYKQHFFAFVNSPFYHISHSKLYVYNSFSQSWIHVGQTPVSSCCASLVLPSDGLITTGHCRGLQPLLKLSLKGTNIQISVCPV